MNRLPPSRAAGRPRADGAGLAGLLLCLGLCTPGAALAWSQAHAQTGPILGDQSRPAPITQPHAGIQAPAMEPVSATEQALQRLRAQAGGGGSGGQALPGAPTDAGAATRAQPRHAMRPPRAGATDTSARDAAWLLGLLALHGIAMPADPAQAQQWFDKARQAGHPLAPAGLAWCAIDGCTTAPNPAAARPWIAQLRAADPARALYLEWWVATRLAPLPRSEPHSLPGPGPGPGRDAATGAQPYHALLLRAAQAGSAGALTELGLENVAQGQLQPALERFRAAAERSPAAAGNARRLASQLQGEDPVRPGAGASATGRTSAGQFFAQALLYHRGEGVPSNYAEAIRLYQVAAASGSAPARRMLELIYSRPAPDGTVDIGWMQQLAQFDVTRPGSLRPALPAPGPQPFSRDPTPLYDLVPPVWRDLGPASGPMR